MDIMASMMLTHSWLKFTDMPLFTMFIVTCIQTSNIDSSKPEGLSPCPVYWCDPYRKVLSVMSPWGWQFIAETCWRVHVYEWLVILYNLCAYAGVHKWLQVQCI